MHTLKLWLAQSRANFLLLSVFLVLIGSALALNSGSSLELFSIVDGLIVLSGVISTHLSVNLFNEYYDYKTGIDFHTFRTPFSGGSGIVSKGKLPLNEVFWAAIFFLILAFSTGLYFSITAHWFLLVFIAIGAITIIFYNTVLSRIYLGEIFAGLSLGTLVVYGTFIALTADQSDSWSRLLPGNVLLIGLFPGIFTFLLLFINEFPDLEADKMGGRKHLIILLGRNRAVYVYMSLIIMAFIGIFLLFLFGTYSFWVLLPLVLFPYAVKTIYYAVRCRNYQADFIPVQMRNTFTVLGVDLLLAVAVFIESF